MPDQEAAVAAGVGRRLRERGARAAVAVVPPLRREVATLQREGADPAQAEVLGDAADLGLVVVVERVVAEGVRRDQPRVVLLDGEQVARARGRRAGSARGRAPTRGRRSRPRPGISTISSTVTRLLARGPGHVTDQRQPAYPVRVHAKRWVTTRSPSTTWPRCSPTSAAPTSSTRAARAWSTAATAAASALARTLGHHGRNHGPSVGRAVRSGRIRVPFVSSTDRRGQDGDMSQPGPESPTEETPTRPSTGADRRAAARPRPSAGAGSAARATGRAGRFVGPPGPARRAGRGRRRVRPVPADRDAHLQHRRRRRGRDLAGRHPVLPGADRRGARPGGAVPRR